MAEGAIGLSDVSSKDTGKGSKLKTGGRRSNNMPKACVDRLIKQGKSPAEAHKLCYPKGMTKEETSAGFQGTPQSISAKMKKNPSFKRGMEEHYGYPDK
jgi:hypothetical protein